MLVRGPGWFNELGGCRAGWVNELGGCRARVVQ